MYLIQTVSQICRPQARKLCQQNSSVNIRLQVNQDLAFDLYSIVLIGTNIDRTTDKKNLLKNIVWLSSFLQLFTKEFTCHYAQLSVDANKQVRKLFQLY